MKCPATTIIIACWIAMAIALVALRMRDDNRQGVWINCSVSEISPDFTPEMRNACRQMRSNNAGRT